MDTAGAMLGPLLAFGLLARGAAALRRASSSSASASRSSASRVLVAARARRAAPRAADAPSRRRAAMGRALGLLRVPPSAASARRRRARPGDRSATASSTSACSDRIGFAPRYLPLLFVGTAVVFMVLAVPMGRLADRVGRGRVFVGGYVLLLCVYSSLLLSSISPFALVLVPRRLRGLLRRHRRRRDGAGRRAAARGAARRAAWASLTAVVAAVAPVRGDRSSARCGRSAASTRPCWSSPRSLAAAIVMAAVVLVRREVAPLAA